MAYGRDDRANFRSSGGRRVSDRGRGARRRSAGGGRVWPLMLALPLAAFGAVFVFGLPDASALSFGGRSDDLESARFALCAGADARDNCVIDGDTFWYRGDKIRIADINAPEAGDPQCHAEARLAARATGRLYDLLNAGPFTLEPIDRDRDQYDRLLRVVTRDGKSLGATMVRAGLAEEWRGYRGSWC